MCGAATQNLKFFYFLLFSEAPAAPCLLLKNVWEGVKSLSLVPLNHGSGSLQLLCYI